jgi:peptidoglycan/xylan/chitin deacetylase (PgdA/CDA1 family)
MTGGKPKIAFTIDIDSFEMIIDSYGAHPPRHLSTFEDMLEQTIDFIGSRLSKATLFIAGIQVKSSKTKRLLREAHDLGFEIGNHTLSHLSYYHTLPFEECKSEIADNDKLLSDIIGAKIVGFRGPGWNWNDRVSDILMELGYRYASNVIPSPVLVTIGKLHAIFSLKQLALNQRKTMGVFRKTFSGNRPFVIRQDGDNLLYELPVSVAFLVPMMATLHAKRFGELVFPWQLRKRIWNYSAHGHDFFFPDEITKGELCRISRQADHYLNPSFLFPEEKRRKFADGLLSRLSQLYEITTGIDCVSSLNREAVA